MDAKRTQLQRRTVLCGRRRRFSSHAAAHPATTRRRPRL